MKQVQVQIRFPKNSELQSQMKQAIDVLQKSASLDLKLDTKSFTNSLTDMSTTLKSLKNQLKSFGVLDAVINENQVKTSTDAINKQTQALKVQQDIIKGSKVMKTSSNQLVNSDGTKSLIKDLTVVEDKYKNIVTVTNTYDATTQKLKSTIVGTTNEIAKQEQVVMKQQQAFTKLQNSMQGKLNIARNNSLINPTLIGDLQKQLNSINVKSPKSQIDSLNMTIKNLASNDSQIVRLQNNISNLTRSMASSQNKYGSLVNKNDIQNSINEINKLKKALNDVTNGKGMSNTALTQSLNGANSSVKTLTSNAQKASSALKITQRDAMSVGSAIQSTLGKFGIYASTAMTMRSLFNVLKDGVQYVRSLDSAYMNLSITMDMTIGQFDKMKVQVQEISKEMGSSSKNTLDIVQVYANNMSSMEEIMGKVAPSLALSNVAGMDGKDVTKTMQATLNAFKMLEDGTQNAEQATERIGNVLTSISKNMQFDYADGIKNMVDAIQTSGNVAEMSGVSLEKYASTAGAVIEATGMSGDEFANGYKFLSARILQIKSLAEETETTSVETGKAGAVLKQFGIDIETGNGGLKGLDTILEELSPKWQLMTDAEKQYTSEALIGNRNRAKLVAIMESMSKSQELYNIAMSSQGSLMASNEKYVESFEGKLGTLSATFQSLMSNNLNGDFMKGMIDGLSGLLNILDKSTQTFGTFPIIITGVVGALVLFNTKFRQTTQLMMGFNPILNKMFSSMDTYKAKLNKLSEAQANEMKILKGKNLAYQKLGFSTTAIGVKMSALTSKMALTTAGTVALTVASTALNMVLSAGMMFGVTALIGGLFKLGDSMITTKKEAKEMSEALNESITTTSKTVTDAETTLAKMEEIESALANTSNMEEKAKLQKELNNLQVQMGQLLPGAVTGLNDEGLAYASNNGLIKQQIDLKKDKIKLDAIEMASSNTNIKTQIDSLNRLKDTNEKIKLSESQGKDTYREKRMTSDGYGNPMKEVEVGVKISEKAKRKANDEMTALAEELSQKVNAVEVLRSMGETDSSISSILGVDVAVLDQYVASLNNAIPPQSEVSNGIDEIGYSAETTVNQIKGLTDTFNGLSGDISLLEQALADFSTNGALSIELRDKLLTSGDSNLIALLGDENAFLERGNQLLGEKRTLEQQTTDEMINLAMADVNAQAEAEITKMNNSNLSATQRANNEAGTVDNNAINYGIDANNNIIAENDKLNASVNNSNQRGNMEAGLVDSNSKNYSTDESNYSIFENSKLMGLDGITQQRALLEASLVGSNLGAYTADESNYGISLNGKLAKTQSFVNQNNAMMNELMLGQSSGGTQKEPKNPYLSAMKSAPKGNTGVGYYGVGSGSSGGSGYSPVQTYKPSVGGGAGGSSSGSKPSGSSGSSGSSAKVQEKDIVNLEKLSDRYYDLDNELQKVENSLSSLHIEMENADDETRIKLLKQEIGLLNKQQQALENIRKEKDKDRIERKTELYKSGFEFNSDGSSKNSQAHLDKLTSQANSKTGESKEKAIKEVERLSKLMKEYDELLLKDIPKITDEINDMKNEVISAEKEIEDIIKKKHEELADIAKKQRDDYIEGLEKETDKLKSELEKRKKLMNDTWKNDDFGDDLSEKQATLNSLEEQLTQAMRTGDEELIKSIRQQITEAQKEVDNFIRDNERDKANERFDKEQEKLDKDLQNKVDEIILKLSDEEILKMVQSGVTDLTKVMDDITKSTMAMPTIITKIGTIIQDQWIGGLSTFMAGLESIQKFGMNMNFSPKGVNFEGVGSKSVIVNAGGLTIQGNVTEDVLPNLNRMLERNNKQLLKEIQNTLEDR